MSIINEKVSEYLDSKYQPINDELLNFRMENEENGVPLILRETEGMLSLLLDVIKPQRILEIGTAYGYSSLFFARKVPNAVITTIDRGKRMIPIAEKNFEKYDRDNQIDFRQGDASLVLDEMIAELNDGKLEPYDFAFIDAGKSHYKEFFNCSEKLCKPGSVIVCDNILMRGWIVDRSIEGGKRHRTNVKYMKQFLDYIVSREDLTVSLLSSGDGLAIIKLNG